MIRYKLLIQKLSNKPLIRRLWLAAYFVFIFLIFLLFLFPFDRIKSKLESEVRQRTPLELSVAHISPRFFNYFVLNDVVLKDKQGKVLFESKTVSTAVSLFSLLTGGMSVNMKAPAYGGELYVKLHQSKGKQYIALDADGMDIASYSLLKNSGFNFAGKIGGNFEMDGDSGKGRLWVKGVTSRGLKVKGFSVPDLDFEKGWLEAEIKGDRMMVKKLELDGKEMKIRVTGDVMLRAQGAMNLVIKLKPSERLAREQSAILSFLKNRDAEGFYQFTLGGSMSAPMPRL